MTCQRIGDKRSHPQSTTIERTLSEAHITVWPEPVGIRNANRLESPRLNLLDQVRQFGIVVHHGNRRKLNRHWLFSFRGDSLSYCTRPRRELCRKFSLKKQEDHLSRRFRSIACLLSRSLLRQDTEYHLLQLATRPGNTGS